MQTEKLAFRIDEAVNACGIGRSKLYEAISRGDLKIIKVGQRTLVLRAELERFLLSFAGA